MPSTAKGFPYPPLDGTGPNNVPSDIKALADANDSMPGIRGYTQEQVDALPADQKWAGRKIWNVTAGIHQNWNGAQWVNEGGNVDLTPYARKDTAQTFIEDQTIAATKHLLLGDGAAMLQRVAGGGPYWGYNWRWNGANWVRRLADNDASLLEMTDAGDLVYFTNTDPGNTVGSTITWGERFRIGRNGKLTFRQPAGAHPNEFLDLLLDGVNHFSLRTDAAGVMQILLGGDTAIKRAAAGVLTGGSLARHASGSYTGDGVTDRLIALPFNPGFVYVVRDATSYHFSPAGYPAATGAYGLRFVPGDATPWTHGNGNSLRPDIVAGGFRVSGTVSGTLNQSSGVYRYVAFG